MIFSITYYFHQYSCREFTRKHEGVVGIIELESSISISALKPDMSVSSRWSCAFCDLDNYSAVMVAEKSHTVWYSPASRSINQCTSRAASSSGVDKLGQPGIRCSEPLPDIG